MKIPFWVGVWLATCGFWAIFAAIALLLNLRDGWTGLVMFMLMLTVTSFFVDWMHKRDVKSAVEAATQKKGKVKK